MPYLKIQTNRPVDDTTRQAALTRASALVAEALGKPERYVMVAMEPPVPMLFAGDDAPTAYLELKSIGLPAGRTAELSAALCEMAEAVLGIDRDRVYIEFTDAPRAMWGWNGGTF
ncbi:MAG TPA: phenylpyruvate tautomerase MIF-related protein [Gammaproteobacteria bacterium]|nr:phenylpyruvate tautomerase MIF-related protein [Gammaproteobacteria bacterium]